MILRLVEVPVCVSVSVAATATTGVVSNTLSPRRYCDAVPPSASFAVVTEEFVGVRLSESRESVVMTAVPVTFDGDNPEDVIDASTTDPAVGVRVSDRRESVVMTAVPVIADVAKPPAAIFAVVTVPSVGVRVSDRRASLPAAADVALVPSVRALPVPAAASVATVNVTAPPTPVAVTAEPTTSIDEAADVTGSPSSLTARVEPPPVVVTFTVARLTTIDCGGPYTSAVPVVERTTVVTALMSSPIFRFGLHHETRFRLSALVSFLSNPTRRRSTSVSFGRQSTKQQFCR